MGGIQGAAGAGTWTWMLGAGASSAWAVEARPTAVAVSVVTSKAPAMQRRRNPLAVVRALRVEVVEVWFVIAEVFMALMVRPAMAPQ